MTEISGIRSASMSEPRIPLGQIVRDHPLGAAGATRHQGERLSLPDTLPGSGA